MGLSRRGRQLPYSVARFGLVGLAESVAAYLKGTGVSVSLIVPGAVGGEHADTLRVAAREQLGAAEVARMKAERRAMTAGWPSPESMAQIIVDGLRSGRFYIIQEGPGHEDWLGRSMREWAKPEAFLASEL